MNLSDLDLTSLWLSIRLAGVSTGILILLGTPFAWWLAHTRWRYKFLVESIVALPLVLPPTVLGFYLLIALGPRGAVGGAFESLGIASPAFTFTGLIIGSVFYSLPFVVQPLQNSFSAISREPLEVAATLGANWWDTLRYVILPMASPGFITAAVLGFAHTLGEFGVVLMIGGNIPGETRVVSIAIYDHVEALEYRQAHALSALLLVISFLMLLIVYGLNRRFRLSIT